MRLAIFGRTIYFVFSSLLFGVRERQAEWQAKSEKKKKKKTHSDCIDSNVFFFPSGFSVFIFHLDFRVV